MAQRLTICKPGVDPAREPDLASANERMTNAQLLHGRLAIQQPRLLRRFQQVQQQEEIAAYISRRDTLRSEHDTLESQLAEVYADAASKIIAVFSQVRAFRQRRMTELGPPPCGVDGFPEFTALGLLDKVVLYDLDAKVQTWPPHEPFASDYVSSLRFDHPGQHWNDEAVLARRRAELEAERERDAAYHVQAAHDEEARSNREAAERFAAAQRRANGA
jgi:hypothetical protein